MSVIDDKKIIDMNRAAVNKISVAPLIADPDEPQDGDVWVTGGAGDHICKVRINGVTKNLDVISSVDISANATIQATATKTINSDSVVQITITQTVDADSVVQVTDTQTTDSDSVIQATNEQTVTADSEVS